MEPAKNIEPPVSNKKKLDLNNPEYVEALFAMIRFKIEMNKIIADILKDLSMDDIPQNKKEEQTNEGNSYDSREKFVYFYPGYNNNQFIIIESNSEKCYNIIRSKKKLILQLSENQIANKMYQEFIDNHLIHAQELHNASYESEQKVRDELLALKKEALMEYFEINRIIAEVQHKKRLLESQSYVPYIENELIKLLENYRNSILQLNQEFEIIKNDHIYYLNITKNIHEFEENAMILCMECIEEKLTNMNFGIINQIPDEVISEEGDFEYYSSTESFENNPTTKQENKQNDNQNDNQVIHLKNRLLQLQMQLQEYSETKLPELFIRYNNGKSDFVSISGLEEIVSFSFNIESNNKKYNNIIEMLSLLSNIGHYQTIDTIINITNEYSFYKNDIKEILTIKLRDSSKINKAFYKQLTEPKIQKLIEIRIKYLMQSISFNGYSDEFNINIKYNDEEFELLEKQIKNSIEDSQKILDLEKIQNDKIQEKSEKVVKKFINKSEYQQFIELIANNNIFFINGIVGKEFFSNKDKKEFNEQIKKHCKIPNEENVQQEEEEKMQYNNNAYKGSNKQNPTEEVKKPYTNNSNNANQRKNNNGEDKDNSKSSEEKKKANNIKLNEEIQKNSISAILSEYESKMKSDKAEILKSIEAQGVTLSFYHGLGSENSDGLVEKPEQKEYKFTAIIQGKFGIIQPNFHLYNLYNLFDTSESTNEVY